MQDDSGKLNVSDEELSAILQDESEAAIGMEWNDDTLSGERKRALEYFKGEMNDLPTLANRSTAIDTTVADTIETILPDLMAIFTEEDIVEFEPQGDEDVDAARQETDFIRHVIFNENRGWQHLYTAFKDALMVKMGVWHWWAEIEEESDENTLVTQNEAEAIAAVYQAEAQGAELADYEVDREAQIIKLVFVTESKEFKVCFKAVAPEDVWFSDDAESMTACTYVGMRSRVREQDLIADGYDEDKVKQLQTYSTDTDQTQDARDTVDETQDFDRGGMNGLRKVEVHCHYINTDLDGDGIKCWKITTGEACKPILDVERVAGVPFASITPFINPHRLIGQSMADKTMEIQKTKTSLKRMMLDSGYFALNQRHEIVMRNPDPNTIEDYLNNAPGAPVRVSEPNTVRPISNASLGFDVTQALEYTATENEMRSGVIRNNMGLNGDALHETASGQRSQENMGQRRTRMIARSFAETGFRDLCLGIHNLLRDSALGPMRKRINGETVEVDPSTWGVRKDMTIEIGSGGKDASRQAVLEVLTLLEKVVALQGSLEGPVIDVTGAHRVLSKYVDLLPVKGLSGLFIEPEQAQMQMAQESQEPDPELEVKQSELMMKAGLEQQKIQAKQEADIYRANKEQETSLQRAMMEIQTQANLPDLRPGGDVGR